MFHRRHLAVALLLTLAGTGSFLLASDEFERPPIRYRTSTPQNDITALQEKIDQGEVTLEYDEKQGYLPALLDAVNVPVDSQVLVFSKTSLQARKISPKTPRALYFNDELYIGYCHEGDKLEVAAMDPLLGTVFYTLSQKETATPTLLRQTDDCLTCHASSRTERVPGLLARSVFVNRAGFPIFSRGSQNVDHTTPLESRWGGWYVTGTHGTNIHQGNQIVSSQAVPSEVENTDGLNITSLDDHFDTNQYIAPHSDIVALLVQDHQILTHNRLIRANFSTRQALDYEVMMNRSLGEPEDQRRESTTRRIQSAGDALIEALLMVDEATLTDPITGTSTFQKTFPLKGPRDSKGRSLRDFDLTQRLFKYPCSFLIHSRMFDELPEAMKEYVYTEMWEILANGKHPERYAHITPADRKAILEILRDTKTDLPAFWQPQ